MWKDLTKEELGKLVSELCGKGNRSYRIKVFTDDMNNWKGSVNLEILEEKEGSIETTGETLSFSKGSGSTCSDFITRAIGPDYSQNVFVKSITMVLTSESGKVNLIIENRETYDISEEVISSI